VASPRHFPCINDIPDQLFRPVMIAGGNSTSLAWASNISRTKQLPRSSHEDLGLHTVPSRRLPTYGAGVCCRSIPLIRCECWSHEKLPIPERDSSRCALRPRSTTIVNDSIKYLCLYSVSATRPIPWIAFRQNGCGPSSAHLPAQSGRLDLDFHGWMTTSPLQCEVV
jgi:hypothetical protein